jgi:hypothetical protein
MDQLVPPFQEALTSFKVGDQVRLTLELESNGEALCLFNLSTDLPSLFRFRKALDGLQKEEQVVHLLFKVRGVEGDIAEASDNVAVIWYSHIGGDAETAFS